MGNFTETITLVNPADVAMARRGFITERDIRQVTVDAMPDTGASLLFITEELRQALGLAIKADYYTLIGDGSRKPCKKTEPVEIHWKNRDTVCPAVVMPGVPGILLGAIPLEGLDVRVNPVKKCLEGANGDEPLGLVLNAR